MLDKSSLSIVFGIITFVIIIFIISIIVGLINKDTREATIALLLSVFILIVVLDSVFLSIGGISAIFYYFIL